MATHLAPPQIEGAPFNSSSTPATLRQVAVVIPTYNAEKHWMQLSSTLNQQGITPQQVLIIDSTSTDRTALLAREAGYRVVVIAKSEFHHGKTRQAAAEMTGTADFLLYLTQDAVLADGFAVGAMLLPFQDARVGAVGGRQLARKQADPIEQHARLFNYPAESSVRTFESRLHLGIKAAFLSNSFAAYRRSALLESGGFPSNIIVGEDSAMAAKLLMRGWKVAYQSEACVYHSHPLSLAEEFRRYFDTGVMHQEEAWLLENFGELGGEGSRFVRSEIGYLLQHSPGLLPRAILRTVSKLVAYRLGRAHRRLPFWLKRHLTGHPNFWREQMKQTHLFSA